MLRVAHYDDEKNIKISVKSAFEIKEIDDSELKIDYVEYEDYEEVIESIKDNNFNFDYLILDIFVKKGEKSFKVDDLILDVIKAKNSSLKVIIFSKGDSERGAEKRSYSKKTYPFLMKDYILSKSDVDLLIDTIINDYLSNNISRNFEYWDEYDIFLRAEINSVGEKNLSRIVRNIRKEKKISADTPIKIERMSSGFSGASIFKLHIEGSEVYILKVSKDKEKLDKEIRNAESHYMGIPSRFRINISSEDYGFNGIAAYLIEYARNGKTLFDFLKAKKDKEKEVKIVKFFEDLFLSTNSMKNFYSKEINNNKMKAKSFEFIINPPRDIVNDNYKYNIILYCKVNEALKELMPLLSEKKDEGENEKEATVIKNCILSYIKNSEYENIRIDAIKQRNDLILCHGDFHSKNIMIDDDGRPVIIDTGGMKEDYWCMDICRLMTNLFIWGLDLGKRDYYNINNIQNQVEIAKKIIDLEHIEFDGNSDNNGFIVALNWLIDNIQNIYQGRFCKWEFQLGLLKEFLKISYRNNSIPANKRAIAILSAKECLVSANITFE